MENNGNEEGEKGPSRRKTDWFKDIKGRMKFRKEKLEGIWMILRQIKQRITAQMMLWKEIEEGIETWLRYKETEKRGLQLW